MHANDVRSNESLRHGAYVCVSVPPDRRPALSRLPVVALVERFGLQNEFEPGDGHPSEAVAFLRRVGATPADLADDALLHADVVVHVASPTAATVADFCAELGQALAPEVKPHVLAGVVRPMRYTGNEMHNFAYGHRVLQQAARVMPHAFIVPMSKTADWWRKGWMERHTYMLPRYDDAGRMVNQGHALAAEAGIPCLMRRTYKHRTEPAPPGAYDFVSYFECADADVPTFHAVCAALRDVTKNPEWKFVHEGPTWHGRRVATWGDLFA